MRQTLTEEVEEGQEELERKRLTRGQHPLARTPWALQPVLLRDGQSRTSPIATDAAGRPHSDRKTTLNITFCEITKLDLISHKPLRNGQLS